MSELRDLKNNVESDLAFYAVLTSTDSEYGYILDTSHYGSGIMFSFGAPEYTSGNGFLNNLQHSDDSGMAGAVDIPDENIIGSKSDINFSAITAEGDSLKTLGIVGTKRYIRFRIEWGGGGGGTILVITSKIPEYLPVA
jgi:hypothetical protein